jgi:hypothetical protein
MPPAVPGSAWQPAGRIVKGRTAVYTTVVGTVGAAWIDRSLTRVALYAGTQQPSGTWTNDAAVSPSLSPSLVAAFNSGFQLKQSRGGWFADGRAALPLVTGAASLVILADGSATVGMWGRDATLGPGVIAIRQNLNLLVDSGVPTALVTTANPIAVWGDPLHEQVLTWRSGLGVDNRGNLVYVGGPALDPPALARALVAVGAVRAMELDINPAWVGFDTYTGAGPTLTGSKVLPTMALTPGRFLSPYWRDFVAVFTRP